MCGLFRLRPALKSRWGGSSLRQSILLNQTANCRTRLSRCAHPARCAFLCSVAQRKASAGVMNSDPSRSGKARNCSNVLAGSSSFVPSARRRATYCVNAARMATVVCLHGYYCGTDAGRNTAGNSFGANEKLTTFAHLEFTTPKTAVATWQVRSQVRSKTGWVSAAVPAQMIVWTVPSGRHPRGKAARCRAPAPWSTFGRQRWVVFD
jgi:hypothetical protein